MTVQNFIEWFTQGAMVVLAFVVLAQWVRWRDRVSFDIFLVFGSLALFLIFEQALKFADIEAAWIQPLGVTVLLAHPYLLLRLVAHFRPVPDSLFRFAGTALIVSVASTWLAGVPHNPALGVAFIYFVSVLVYVAWSFRAGALAARGVTHFRMLHAALGALLLATVFVLAIILLIRPTSREEVSGFVPLAALGAALNYYFAFAPPAFVRRIWQSSELYEFLAERGATPVVPSQDQLLDRLCVFVTAAVGAKSAAAALWDEEAAQLIVRVSRWGYLEPGRPIPDRRLLEGWEDGRAVLVQYFEWVLPGGARGSVYAVPIPCNVAPKGVLFAVLPKGALFVSDDLALLSVCCAETAVQLDNTAMRDRQETLIADLAQRSEQLAAVNKELEAFSYSVSHDLRAPLRHVSGFTELLLKSNGPDLDPNRRRYLRLISDSAVKMGELIDALLVFSRMGRSEMLHTRVDLTNIVRAAQRDLTETADSTRAVNWIINPLPQVAGDPSMLQLVFTNLLSNAVKYSRKRTDPTVEIGSRDGTHDEVVVFVRDNGVGFDMAYASRLFGVFQRLHRAEEFEGTGIGLANVQRIVARHGGRVWAESEPDKGATFYVALPKERTA